ncbi:MAG: hypothetical protein ACK479_01185 [Fluviicola sp.]|jgi:hypothetical protein
MILKHITICLLFLFLMNACSHESSDIKLDSKTKSEIKDLLLCDNFEFTQENDSLIITVDNSKLSNEVKRKMGSSVVSLSLYDFFYKNNTIANTQTIFGVAFKDDKSSYYNSLEILASASALNKRVDFTIRDLIKGKKDQVNFYFPLTDSLIEKSKIEWQKVKTFGIFGFETTQITIDETTYPSIVFKYLLFPLKKEIWIYIDKETGKILYLLDAATLNEK